jgi:hypothetical protein
VPIEITEPQSPGWWLDVLSKQLAAKRPRFKLLDDHFRGRPPLVNGSPNERTVFYRFQRIARTNLAALIVQARRERIAARAIRTAATSDRDQGGDPAAWGLYTGNGFEVGMSNLTRQMGVFGETYLANGLAASGPRISVEDPRQTIAACDPLTGEPIAALKLFHDFLSDQDYALLWLQGGLRYVAVKSRKLTVPRQDFAEGPPPPTEVRFSSTAFTFLPFADEIGEGVETPAVTSERYPLQEVPVTRIENQDGVGVFELHTDLLDRINHTILQRVVIATLQAFRQRGIETPPDSEGLPDYDIQGNKIDYNDIFSADPGALWRMPPGAKIWESAEGTLQGILSSVKDDVLHLAAVTQTPLFMFLPDAANQSAAGANAQVEGLVFGVQAWHRLIGRGLARALSLAFKMSSDDTRADMSRIAIDWEPAARPSLTDQATADSLAQSLTWEQKQTIIWQQNPQEVAIARAQRAQDAMLAAAVNPAPPGAQQQQPNPQGARQAQERVSWQPGDIKVNPPGTA